MYQNILDMILVLLYNALILNKYENLKKMKQEFLIIGCDGTHKSDYTTISCASLVEVDGKHHWQFKLQNSSTEESTIKLVELLELKPKRIITWQGRSVIIPQLRLNCMKYMIPSPIFFDTRDKWNNFTIRFSLMHMDLHEVLNDYLVYDGFSEPLTLREVYTKIGYKELPLTTDNKEIAILQMFATTMIYLKYIFIIGDLSLDSYNELRQEFIHKLTSSKSQFARNDLLNTVQ